MNSLIPFIIASAILLIIPGPAVIYIVTRSVDQGRFAGIISVLGIHVGTLIQITAAAFGLSTLLVTSALAFSIVKYLGAAYLLYLGIRKLSGKDSAQEIERTELKRLRSIFYEGILVNALNPKTALFFFAFLPQFVTPNQGPATFQILLLGLIFIGMGLVSDGCYALMAGTLGHWLNQKSLFQHMERYLAGSIYILLVLATALSASRKIKF
jgi:threonine/homoserine/homoserine lactone efflux protein